MTDPRHERLRARWLGALVGLVAVVGLAHAQAPERKSLEVHTARDAQLASQLVIAEKKGFFRDQGLEVQVKYFTAGSEIPPGMAAGSIVMASAGAPNAISLAASNFPMRVIPQMGDVAGAQGGVVRPPARVPGPQGLEGERMGILKGRP